MSLYAQTMAVAPAGPRIEEAIKLLQSQGFSIDFSKATPEEWSLLVSSYNRYLLTPLSQMGNVKKTIIVAPRCIAFQLAIAVREDRDQLAQHRDERFFKTK